MVREAREKLIAVLLQTDWTAGNTFSQTPKITFGWYNEDVGRPQVTIGQPDETPTNGGETGFSHQKEDGSPGQTVQGTDKIHVWSSAEDLKSSGATTDNPRQYNERGCEEIQRIVGNHQVNPANPNTGNQPVAYLAYDGRNAVPDPDRPDVFHYVATVRYGYLD